jgi:hypothetical protein
MQRGVKSLSCIIQRAVKSRRIISQWGVKSSHCILQRRDVTPYCTLHWRVRFYRYKLQRSQILPLYNAAGSQILLLNVISGDCPFNCMKKCPRELFYSITNNDLMGVNNFCTISQLCSTSVLVLRTQNVRI